MTRTCMVVYSYYPFDPRVRKEAERLAKNGYEIDIICLRDKDEKKEETINGINVVRLPMQTAREGSKLRYVYQYVMFFILAFFTLNSMNRKRKYAVVHTHSLPDFIVFTAYWAKRRGAKVILDMHEGMPEIYLSRMGTEKQDFIYRFFVIMEKISATFADKVFSISEYFKELFIARGLDGEKIVAIYNLPDIENIQKPQINQSREIVFAGILNEYSDFGTLLLAISKIDDLHLHIYGDGPKMSLIVDKISSLKIQDKVTIHGWISPRDLHSIIGKYRAGVIPYPDMPITHVALGNKAFEYTTAGIPVISSDMDGVRAVFDESCFYFYKAGNPADLCRAIKDVFSDTGNAMNKVNNSQNVINKNKLTWDEMEKRLVETYKNLSGNDSGA